MKVQGLYQQLRFAHLTIGVAEMRHGIERDQAAASVSAFNHADGTVAHVKTAEAFQRQAGNGAQQGFEQRAVRDDGNALAARSVLLSLGKGRKRAYLQAAPWLWTEICFPRV